LAYSLGVMTEQCLRTDSIYIEQISTMMRKRKSSDYPEHYAWNYRNTNNSHETQNHRLCSVICWEKFAGDENSMKLNETKFTLFCTSCLHSHKHFNKMVNISK
jgi:hypothetical protein